VLLIQIAIYSSKGLSIFCGRKQGNVTPYIEDEDEGHECLRANPLQGGG